MFTPIFKEMEDNCGLMYLNEATLLNNVRLRYNKVCLFYAVLRIRCLFDPWIRDPGLFWPLDPVPFDSWFGIRDPGVKYQDPGPGSRSGLNNPEHISERVKPFFWIKKIKFFNADPESFDSGSGIWDGKNSHPWSGINIPDPQHWFYENLIYFSVNNY